LEFTNVISFLDGKHNLKEIAEILSISNVKVLKIVEILEEHKLID
jgi:hypothetical protein